MAVLATQNTPTIVVQSPVELPRWCVKCARDATAGVQVRRNLHGRSKSPAADLLLHVAAHAVPAFIASPLGIAGMLMNRNSLRITYYLCADHGRRLMLRTRIAISAAATTVGGVAATIATQGARLPMLIGLASFVVAVASYFSRYRLYVAGERAGSFAVQGMSMDFVYRWRGVDDQVLPRRRHAMKRRWSRRDTM